MSESRRRARWYESNAGLGIEIETGIEDPDFAWMIAGAVEPEGRRKPRYKAIIGSGEAMGTGYGNRLGTFTTIEEAKDAVVCALKCEVVAQ